MRKHLFQQLHRAGVSLLFSCCLTAPALAASSGNNGEVLIGNFSFPTSASPQAQEHFELGVGFLHSYGWTQARNAFRKAQEVDPDFALAYWGEAFSYNHPLMQPEWEPEAPAQVLLKLGASSEARLAKAPTEREKGFLRAAEAYAFNENGLAAKRMAWMEAMKSHYEAFPEDPEVAAFYATSLLSAATVAGNQSNRLNMLAGSIALELFHENPDHPGAAHYTIHAFDDPEHAPIALPAALKYATIAPAVAHARHMPTHIFIQRGMWQEVADYNVSAFQAAEELWQPGDRPNDLIHAAEWGQYGDLQLADYEHAREWMAKLESVAADNPGNARVFATLALMQARFIVETRQWQIGEVNSEVEDAELLASGISAFHLDRPRVLAAAAAEFAQRKQSRPDDIDLAIRERELSALLSLQEGNPDRASAAFEEALSLTDSKSPPRGPVTPIKPAHELYGEAMLAAGRYQQAAELFEQSLLLTPNRPWSLLGLARAYANLDQVEAARESYEKLGGIWSGNDELPGYQEATEYLADQ